MPAPDDTAPGASTGKDRSASRLALLLGPCVAMLLGWAAVWALDSLRDANEALIAGLLFLTPLGPTIIFGPAVIGTLNFEHLGTWSLVAVAAVMTVLTTFFYAWNLDLLERLPRIGPWLAREHRNAAQTLEQKPWIRRWATFGVGFFVFLPLPGSGTLGGSFMGRLVGLTRAATFVAVAIAGVVVTLLYGWFGTALQRYSDEHGLGVPVKVAGALGFVVVLALLGRWLMRMGHSPAPPPADAPPPTSR